MSKRYETDGSKARLEVIDPDHELFWDEIEILPAGRHALVIGDPWASAYAIVGSHAELRQFAAAVTNRLDATDPTRPELVGRDLTVWIHTEELWRDLEAALGLPSLGLGRFKPWARQYPKHLHPEYDLDKAIEWAREHGIPFTVQTRVHHHGTTGTVDANEYLAIATATDDSMPSHQPNEQ